MNQNELPSVGAMVTAAFTIEQWLTYYQNVWTRNLAANVIDLKMAVDEVAENPDQKVKSDTQNMDGSREEMSALERLEYRKTVAANAVRLLTAINALVALSPEDLAALYSDQALTPAVPAKKEEETITPTLVSYSVATGQQVTTPDGVVHAEATTLELDPNDAQTQEWLTANLIAVTPAAEPDPSAAV